MLSIVLLLWHNKAFILFSRYSRVVPEQVACQCKLQKGYLNRENHSSPESVKVREIWKYYDAIYHKMSGIVLFIVRCDKQAPSAAEDTATPT